MNKRRNHCMNDVARGRTAKPESSPIHPCVEPPASLVESVRAPHFGPLVRWGSKDRKGDQLCEG
jgi:hypothetical protein